MKYIKQILFTLSILTTFINYSFALDVCPGVSRTLTWSSSNITGNCTPSYTGAPACNFNPQPNVAGTSTVNIPTDATNSPSGKFCVSTITCTNNANPPVTSTMSDDIRIKNNGQCNTCPAGSVPNNTTPGSIYSGNGCIRPTATITGGSCIIPIGASSCTVPVSFTTTNLDVSQAGLFNIARTGTSSNSYYNGFVYGGTSYMSIPGRPADKADVSVGGGTPITLRVNAINGAGVFTIDGSGTVTGNCATGSAWNGSMCTPSTVSGSVTANSCTVAFGQSTCTSPISWTSNGFNPSTMNLFGCTQPSCRYVGRVQTRRVCMNPTFVLCDDGGFEPALRILRFFVSPVGWAKGFLPTIIANRKRLFSPLPWFIVVGKRRALLPTLRGCLILWALSNPLFLST
jgi:hypothetical protein